MFWIRSVSSGEERNGLDVTNKVCMEIGVESIRWLACVLPVRWSWIATGRKRHTVGSDNEGWKMVREWRMRRRRKHGVDRYIPRRRPEEERRSTHWQYE